MPDSVGRRRAVSAAILSAALLISIVPAVTNSASPPAGLERFLYALGQVESGGSYTARNPVSGAYGKYQIIPSSWAAWAKSYLGSSTAPKTPANQEIVAHRKVTALFVWLDSWPAVAHWWLTGSAGRDPSQWSSFSRTYVNRVISLMRSTGDIQARPTSASSIHWIDSKDKRVGDASAAIKYSGAWATARYSAYSSHRARYALKSGSSATLTFTGTGIAWIGPTGPTRGAARIFIDGKAVASINLRRSSFHARTVLYSRHFSKSSRHTIRIVVTSNHRPVAIDEMIVGT